MVFTEERNASLSLKNSRFRKFSVKLMLDPLNLLIRVHSWRAVRTNEGLICHHLTTTHQPCP